MTHYELLDRIAQAGLEPHGNVMPTHLVLSLRAVVELHRNVDGACWECQDSIYHEYPCPTIRAIEKELG